MKTIDNYKNIRRKAQIMGLSPMFFILFFSLSAVACLTLTTGVSFIKIILILSFSGGTYGVCYFLNKNDLAESVMNKKFPKEISNLTENDE